MDKGQLTEIVRDALEVCSVNVGPFAPAASLTEDLALDSLDCTDVLMDLEDTLDVALPDAEAATCRTVGDLIELAWAKVKAKQLSAES